MHYYYWRTVGGRVVINYDNNKEKDKMRKSIIEAFPVTKDANVVKRYLDAHNNNTVDIDFMCRANEEVLLELAKEWQEEYNKENH